jgi:GNAT superfamily N-acetyltransferase
MKMNIEIKKLTSDLLDDWLHFFDHKAFEDNEDWFGCFCMFYHWTEALAANKAWNCSRDNAPYNRSCAIDAIKEGKMQGYLAYLDGRVVGWCNANDKNAYSNVNVTFPPTLSNARVKSVVCFCIAHEARGKGVATKLLDRVCSDAATERYNFVEAYPFQNDMHHAYHGPQRMYEKHGFINCGLNNGCFIYRKEL